jgi:hypothetical protein
MSDLAHLPLVDHQMSHVQYRAAALKVKASSGSLARRNRPCHI